MMKLRALDPQPSLLLDADGSVIEANAALLELRNGDEPGPWNLCCQSTSRHWSMQH